uniref:ribosomal protein L16 n=1 Tax=Gayralia brasiliensis TaxID=1286870 RepID=UPI002411113B|nr:ribosomal protein L16 [Gayralia brasiliensis]YP_010733831.1 ribosomal protein L16 [Monostroma nitidum]WEG93073.1 ribosomal protein L16 [Gayralia brasiliensis]WEG93102.1 ribosomal protein L16 [Monostroma nitidum]
MLCETNKLFDQHKSCCLAITNTKDYLENLAQSNFKSLIKTAELIMVESTKVQQKIGCLSINSQIDAPSLFLTNTEFSEKSSGIDKIRFGDRGFYFCSWGTITAKFIETTRLLIARKLKKAGRFWIRICPDTPVTQGPAETRMGRGKGGITHYEAKIRPGQIFIEFSGVPQANISEIYKQLCKKTPIKMKYI